MHHEDSLVHEGGRGGKLNLCAWGKKIEKNTTFILFFLNYMNHFNMFNMFKNLDLLYWKWGKNDNMFKGKKKDTCFTSVLY